MNIELLQTICVGHNTPVILDGFLDTISPATTCAFNKYGSLLAVGCNDGTIIIWDFSTRQIAKIISAHCHPIACVNWSKNGRQILTGSNDRNVAVWDVLSGECQFRCSFASPVVTAQFDPSDSSLILVVPLNESATLLNIDKNGTNSYKCLPSYLDSHMITTASFDGTGQHIYLGNTSSLILIVDTKSLKMLTAFKVGTASGANAIKNLAFSTNNQLVLVNASDRIIRTYRQSTILAYDLKNRIIQSPMQTFQDAVTRSIWKRCRFSGDDQYVCAASMNQYKLYIWETVNGCLVRILHDGIRNGRTLDVSWHPINNSIIVSICSGIVSIWTQNHVYSVSQFLPGFTEIDTNIIYEERESEFDIDDEDKSSCGDAVTASANDDIDIDVETCAGTIYEEERNLDYLIYIPISPVIDQPEMMCPFIDTDQEIIESTNELINILS